jgi:predicted transcriptional regulator
MDQFCSSENPNSSTLRQSISTIALQLVQDHKWIDTTTNNHHHLLLQ